MLGKADMDAPASKPREDSPASGASPEVQAPGKIVYTEQHPPRLCGNASAPVRVTSAARQPRVDGVTGPFSFAAPAFSEPIPADDEQVEGAA